MHDEEPEDTELWPDIIRVQHEQNISFPEARRVARASAFLKARKIRRLEELEQRKNA